MYRTCLFCHADLGANREIEALPTPWDCPNGDDQLHQLKEREK
jgi:hypothetical protein